MQKHLSPVILAGILAIAMGSAVPAMAQIGPDGGLTLQPVSVAPSGACANTALRLYTPSGMIYTCQSGNWATSSAGGTCSTLTGDVSGSCAATVVSLVGGATSTDVAAATALANAATSANTASAIVRRDSSGNFVASAITGTSFSTSTWIIDNSFTGFPNTLFFRPTATNSQGRMRVGPSGTATRSVLTLNNLSGSSNTNQANVELDLNGAVASLLSNGSGTSATIPITTWKFGEAFLTTGTLAEIDFQFNGATKAFLTPTRWTVPALTVSGLTTGIGHYDGSGNLTSSAVDLAAEVTGLLPNANLANPSVTVNGTTCTLGASCTPSGSNAITGLTADVSASGPGSVAATVNSVGGSTAANVHSAELAANAATNLNTASTTVKRDASGNFVAGTITAALTGTASGNEVPLTFNTGLTRTSNTVTATANVRTRAIGATFDGGGAVLTAGITKYLTVPFACTISAWNIAVDTGTATVDVWKIATGTSVPSLANTITASVVPAISTGTAIHSTTLTGWTTAATANDIWGFNLKVVGGSATQVNAIVECDQ